MFHRSSLHPRAQDRDNIMAEELALMQRYGVMSKRWNGSAEREKLAAHRKIWRLRKTTERNDQLTSYDTLKGELDTGDEENKASLEREKIPNTQIKTLQAQMKLDRHRSDLAAEVNDLRKDVAEEKSIRRDWKIRRTEIKGELDRLRKEGLAGVRINGRRPTERPSGYETPSDPTIVGSGSEMGTSSANPDLGPVAAGMPEGNHDAAFQGESEKKVASDIEIIHRQAHLQMSIMATIPVIFLTLAP